MTLVRRHRLLRIAAVLAIVGLTCFVWSVLDPRPLPIIVAMSIGQAFGTLSLATFLVVAAIDYLRVVRAAGDDVPKSEQPR